MTFDDPGDPFFGHLDDPSPPMHGGDALTHVMQRGHQIRRRRRTTYSASTAVVVIAITGAAIGLASSHSPHNSQTISTLKSPSSSTSSHPHSPKRTRTQGPGGIVDTTRSTPHRHQSPGGGATTPATPVCVSTTPTVAPPSTSPTSDPSANATGQPQTGATSSPTPTPTKTCESATPAPSTTATPTDSSSAATSTP